MDENLLGYVLEALDPDSRGEVEAHLRTHPEAQARLELLEKAVGPLGADAEDPVPPPGLVLATLARIAEHQCRRLPPAPPPSPRQLGVPGRRWARRPDVLVAALLLLLVGGLSLAALVQQWRAYQRQACANNLRGLWVGLERYSDQQGGKFPCVEAKGPTGIAGIFIPVLQDAGVLANPVSVACPAARGRRPPSSHSVRELTGLYRTDPEAFDAAARDLAGDYGYSLGYREGGTQCGLRRDLDNRLPILADAPGPGPEGNSPNHGGSGQNVLSIGGHVRWCTERTVGLGGDDIYLNRLNERRAGLDCNDTVLGPSDASP